MTTTRLTTALIALAALASGCYSSSTTYVASDSVSGPVSTGYVEYEVWYHDPHPVHVVDEHAGDWCFIEGAHSHYYEPEHLDFYVVDSGYYHFIGDPSYYVHDTTYVTVYAYTGHHPAYVDHHWCYIHGPHYHHWAPRHH